MRVLRSLHIHSTSTVMVPSAWTVMVNCTAIMGSMTLLAAIRQRR
jgi:hypothetical protein